MELMVVMLNKEEHLETILSILAELEISDVTIQDGERLGSFLAHEVPIFAGLRQMLGEKRVACKTILALIEQKDFLSVFNKFLTDEKIDFTQEGVGTIAIVPVNSVIKPKD